MQEEARSVDAPSWIGTDSDPLKHGHRSFRGCPRIFGTRMLAANPFESCGSQGSWVLMDRTYSGTSYGCVIRLGSGEISGQVDPRAF